MYASALLLPCSVIVYTGLHLIAITFYATVWQNMRCCVRQVFWLGIFEIRLASLSETGAC